MENNETGQRRTFIKNGVEYKRIKTVKTEREAEEIAKKLKEESGSKRFETVIEKKRWVLAYNFGLLRKIGRTTYRVYVPIRR
jgi:hypothetical protein